MTTMKVLILIFAISCSGVLANHNKLQSNIRLDDNLLVGTRYYKWTDESRLDEEYEKNSYREIHVQIWFPIDKTKISSANYKRASYMPELNKARPFLTNWSDQDFLEVKNIKTHSLVNTKISNQKDKYPVLILSPSLAGHTSFYTYYAERLANLGYIVVGVNHKYESNYVISKEGKVTYRNLKFHDDLKKLKIPQEITAEGYRKKRGRRITVLGRDLVFCLNQLSLVNKLDFGNRLELTKVGAFGHSVGGGAAIDAAKLDKRFVTIINIDGTPSYWALKTGMDQPFMYIEDLKDLKHKGNKIQYDRRNNFCKKVKSDCYRVLVPNTNHNSFVGSNYYSSDSDSEKKKVLKVLNTTLNYLTSFFDKYLRDKNSEIKDENSKDVRVLSFLKNRPQKSAM